MDLEIWRNGECIALISEKRKRMQLRYTDGARPIGAPLVSVAMAVSSKPYGDKKVRAFLRGLLPE
ncbi:MULTISPECIES: HipA N-terminal domain-containing protein [Acidithrix]|uniref:HipA N-terminal subdomain 1 domain-containing protein n=1 Tax=Acidithrix ferrooxidans TaxID=1280514 RepID=A0A0D8HKP8_9ACTN|nr:MULTISPECIES: HipA N-terminal domain-containing protein [Acidithrix]KJF17636.1 hypothetical protein AXFE_15360 [Acidithrix ferrooxidans]CAG4907291.1 unnamed protein product [Acidithrix sp. C25]